MSEIPSGWSLLTLNELTGTGGLMTDGDWIESKDQDPSGEVRLIQLADIGDGEFLNRSARFLTKQRAEELQCTYLREGDVLIARMPDPLGRACIFPGIGQEAITAVDVCIWRPGIGGASPDWVKHIVNSPQIRTQIASLASGTTRQRVSGGNLKRLEIPTPPPAEQRRIVARLDALLGHLALARAELARVPRLAERNRQAVLAAAFSGELTREWRENNPVSYLNTETDQLSNSRIKRRRATVSQEAFAPPYQIPPQWKWTSLPTLGILDRGRSRHRPRNDKKLYGGPYPFIQTGDIKAAKGHLTSYSQTYSEDGLAQSRLWPKGTLCITIAANIAETAILGIDACFPDSIVGFTADEALCIPLFIEFFIRTIKSDLATFAPATAQKNINLETLSAVQIPYPPLPEQREIVRRIEMALARIGRAEAEAARAAALLERLEQETLARAFRGEL